MTKSVRTPGERVRGCPTCRKCGAQLESKKRRESGLCLQCAGGGSLCPLRDCAGAIALKSLLEKRGLTQQQFADEIGGEVNLVGKWCRGAWRPQTYWQRLLEERYQIPRSAWPPKKRGGHPRSEAQRGAQRLVEVQFVGPGKVRRVREHPCSITSPACKGGGR